MTIELFTNKSESNSLNKELEPILTLNGTLRNESSIINPTILIEADISALTNCNYMYIEDFDRYYFVRNITSVRNDLVRIEAHVDVLYTFKDEILANTAIIKRQENTFNLFVDDGAFKVYANPIVDVKNFPNGFGSYQYVLAVAGSR